MKIRNTFLKLFAPHLEYWKSIPAAHYVFKREHPDFPTPSLRTLYYHVSDCMSLNKAFESD